MEEVAEQRKCDFQLPAAGMVLNDEAATQSMPAAHNQTHVYTIASLWRRLLPC
jgi:hypothetical protein